MMDYLIAGTRFVAAVLIAPVKNEQQEVIMFLITLRDITALRENKRKSRRFSLLSTTNSHYHSHSTNNIHNNVDHNSGKSFCKNVISNIGQVI